jgi:hypothetical protein
MIEISCSLCHTPLEEIAPRHICQGCQSIAHADCWNENCGCGTYGCPNAPDVSKQASAESPTWWGQETKICPQCGQEIKAAALRCRHCQTVFPTAAPMTREGLRAVQNQAQAGDQHKVWAVLLFAGGLIPFLAPVAALLGACLWLAFPLVIKSLPPLHKLLARIGLILSLVWILIGGIVLVTGSGGSR